MNIKQLVTDFKDDTATKEDINLEHHVNKLSQYIGLEKPLDKLKQQYNIVLYYNTKATFNNTAELLSTEKKLCSHYTKKNKE